MRILEGAHGTDARTRVLIESGDGEREWGTVGVEDNVIAASWQALEEAVHLLPAPRRIRRRLRESNGPPGHCRNHEHRDQRQRRAGSLRDQAGRELAGFVVYEKREGSVVLVHTEVDPAFKGRGVGGSLARGVLDDLRAKGVSVVPLCPFVKGWIDKHPEYRDMVAA